ncbi:MAG: patatin-like phospholipase family protein [Microscillaceae bacterium]|nr:patatin-like phospholipase family protein [Microscillaceae bacterium]MDW8461351.1 patatin-like phospholipase family protein [Cytophagales bacterium]
MANTQKKSLALALQGGGAHGAYTWGVLDRFLEEKNLELKGFTGTSAGAMNAVVLAYGLHKGGNEMARELLHKFWKTVSDYSKIFPLQPSPWDKLFGKGNMDNSPGFIFIDLFSQFISPYQYNILDYNPLRDILNRIVDFEALRQCQVTKIFLCATNVRRGRVRVFKTHEVTVEACLASACLPFLFKAVTIDGEDYWDGGYMGNPPIFPLIDGTDCTDIMIVQVNPINIPKTPTNASEIRDRINELSFNSSLMLEMRKIEFIDRLLDRGIDLGGRFRKIFIHNINPEEEIWSLNLSSKLNADWDYLLHLKSIGRKYADEWLAKNYDLIGKQHTCNIRETFM